MNRSHHFLCILLVLTALFAVSPASAFNSKNLDIAIQPDASADISFTYELSWYENIAVFARIADPATELKKALVSQFNKPVDVVSVTGNSVNFHVAGFASSTEEAGHVTMVTPALSFREAQESLKKYWFAPLINPDFSPDLTRVSFPDGYDETFSNEDHIPAITHVMNSR